MTKHAKRYVPNATDMLKIMSNPLTASEKAIVWFLRAYELEHGRGATKQEVLDYALIPERSFARSWKRLEDSGLVRVEMKLTDAGRAMPTTSNEAI